MRVHLLLEEGVTVKSLIVFGRVQTEAGFLLGRWGEADRCSRRASLQVLNGMFRGFLVKKRNEQTKQVSG